LIQIDSVLYLNSCTVSTGGSESVSESARLRHWPELPIWLQVPVMGVLYTSRPLSSVRCTVPNTRRECQPENCTFRPPQHSLPSSFFCIHFTCGGQSAFSIVSSSQFRRCCTCHRVLARRHSFTATTKTLLSPSPRPSARIVALSFPKTDDRFCTCT
jgi:hypothetical protein